MPVQDDERERELVRSFNLSWDRAHSRGGIDAYLDVELDGTGYRFEVEVKSSTSGTVATARDFGLDHLLRWRRMLFAIGFYDKQQGRPELQTCLCLTPLDLEPWIASIESKTALDLKLAERVPQRLGMEDLFYVCGRQSSYSLEDARRLHKQQWSALEYEQALDIVENEVPMISQAKMLEILQLRARYIAERGATLNNPHIGKKDLAPFFGTDREVAGTDWADTIRKVARKFIQGHPDHPAVVAARVAGHSVVSPAGI